MRGGLRNQLRRQLGILAELHRRCRVARLQAMADCIAALADEIETILAAERADSEALEAALPVVADGIMVVFERLEDTEGQA
jgi:hypothetical protein